MNLYSIGLTDSVEDFRRKLDRGCQPLVRQGIRINIDEEKKGRYVFLHCQVVEGELSFPTYERLKGQMKTCIARLVADEIMGREEERLVRRIIDRAYAELTVEERLLVGRRMRDILTRYSDTAINYATMMRGRIIGRVLEYLEEAHELNVEGFLKFRLQDYQRALRDAITTAADDYLLEREYKDFIRLLRYFVEVQEPRIEEVHLIIGRSGGFSIVDRQGARVINQYLEDSFLLNQDGVSHEDLLLSALISIAPHIIMVHGAAYLKDKEILETIKNVFENRVLECSGCDLCRRSYEAQFTGK